MDLNNIVGFKAVDKNGNERQVTVDEMTELVSARIVSAASEISTFAAAAAAGTDEFEDQLPQSDTFSWLRTLDGSKNPTLTSSSAAAKVLGELFTSLKLFPFMERGSVSDLNTATNNGYYNLTGSVSNFPIENMWTTMLVIGGAYKIQVVFNVTNDISELYIRKYYLSDNTFTKWKIFT